MHASGRHRPEVATHACVVVVIDSSYMRPGFYYQPKIKSRVSSGQNASVRFSAPFKHVCVCARACARVSVFACMRARACVCVCVNAKLKTL